VALNFEVTEILFMCLYYFFFKDKIVLHHVVLLLVSVVSVNWQVIPILDSAHGI